MNKHKLIKVDDPIVNRNAIGRMMEMQFKRVFRMITLMNILNKLDEHDYMRVEDLADELGQSKSLTSQNLKKLADIGIVEFKADGKYHEYQINKQNLSFLLIINDLCCMKYNKPIRNPENEEILVKLAEILGINTSIKHHSDYADRYRGRYNWSDYVKK